MSKEVYKLIALDMDGVVNSSQLIYTWIDSKCKELSHIEDPIQRRRTAREAYFKEFANGYEAIFPELAAKISRICYETGADIVWTSTWRNGYPYRRIEDAREMFTRRGLLGNRLVGYTPDLGGDKYRCSRGAEIRSYLKSREIAEDLTIRCAIIDDRPDAGAGAPEYAELFLTNEQTGITDDIVEDVIAFLNKAD